MKERGVIETSRPSKTPGDRGGSIAVMGQRKISEVSPKLGKHGWGVAVGGRVRRSIRRFEKRGVRHIVKTEGECSCEEEAAWPRPHAEGRKWGPRG